MSKNPFQLNTVAILVLAAVGLLALASLTANKNPTVLQSFASEQAKKLQCPSGTEPALVCRHESGRKGVGPCEWECTPVPTPFPTQKPTYLPIPTITRFPITPPPISPHPTSCPEIVCPLNCTKTTNPGGCDYCDCRPAL